MAASEVQKSVDRARTIFIQLLKQLPPAERDKHLGRHLADIQSATDILLATLTGEAAPASIRGRSSKAPPEPTEGPIPLLPLEDDSATVPGSVRAVLANEKDGVSARAIVAGVLLLRPGTSDASVHGALHQMKKRGEIARTGFHKNFKYTLISSFGAAQVAQSIASSVNGGDAPPRGGETH